MDLRIHPLHRQVRTLDDAHLNARIPRVHARARPLLEALEGTERIGQVGLKDDTGLVAAHVRLVEDGGEHRDRQIEVLVVLHVEVEEGPIVAGKAVEGQEGTHAMLNNFLETPGIVRSRHGRDLDGDVIDVLASHEARDLGQAMGRFLLTKNRLAEEVHVQAVAACAQARERRAETPVGCVDDQVADDLAEHASRHRRHSAGCEARCGRSEPHRRGQGRGQEVFTAGRQALQRLTGHVQIRGTHDVVNESSGERQTVRVGQDPGENLGRLRSRLMGRFIGPAAGSNDRSLPQRPQIIGAASSVGIGVGRGRNGDVRHA